MCFRFPCTDDYFCLNAIPILAFSGHIDFISELDLLTEFDR